MSKFAVMERLALEVGMTLMHQQNTIIALLAAGGVSDEAKAAAASTQRVGIEKIQLIVDILKKDDLPRKAQII